MKKRTRILNFTSHAIFSTLIFLVVFSCTKEVPQKSIPIIEFISPSGTEANVEPYEKTAISLVTTTGSDVDDRLINFKIFKRYEFEDIDVIMDSAIDLQTFQLSNYEIRVRNNIGTEIWTFQTTDKSMDITSRNLTYLIDGPIINLAPALSLKSGIHEETGMTYVDNDEIFETNEHFIFGFTAISQSDKELKKILITQNYQFEYEQTVMDSSINVFSYSFEVETAAFHMPGFQVFTITAIGEDDFSTSVEFTITSIFESHLNIYSNISLGSFTSSIPCVFSSSTGQTFNLSEVNDAATQKKIDFVYFHDSTYGHTLAAPSSEIAGEIYASSIASWDNLNRNITLFGLTAMNVGSYTNIETKSQLILSILNDGVELNEEFQSEFNSDPSGFSVGDIIAFETDDGNQGLMKINEVNQGATNGESTIKYDLKVAISGKR